MEQNNLLNEISKQVYTQLNEKIEKQKNNGHFRYKQNVAQDAVMDFYLDKICDVCDYKEQCKKANEETDYNLENCPIFAKFHFASVNSKCEPIAHEEIQKNLYKENELKDKKIILYFEPMIDKVAEELADKYLKGNQTLCVTFKLNTEQKKLLEDLKQELCCYCSYNYMCNNKHDCKILNYFRDDFHFVYHAKK